MNETVSKYLYTDECGDTYKVEFREAHCCCSGSCYPDRLYVEDYPGSGEFLSQDIDCQEISWMIKDLLDKALVEDKDSD